MVSRKISRKKSAPLGGDAMKRYDVVRKSWGQERTVASALPWPKAWRHADKLNVEARRDFQEGRITYDVPWYEVKEATP